MMPAEAMLTHALAMANANGVVLWNEGAAIRYRGSREAVERLLPTLKVHKQALIALLETITEACHDVEGITPEQFLSLLNEDDMREIAAGLIPAEPTLRAYAESFAKGIREGRVRLLLKRVLVKDYLIAKEYASQ